MLAKSRLNNIETLMSQALINLEVTHEEFKQMYEQMKENIRNIKSRGELSENTRVCCMTYALHDILFF